MPAGNRRPLYSGDELPVAGTGTASLHAPAAQTSDSPAPMSGDTAYATADAPFRQPCTFKGLASAAYAGALGYFLGFVPATFKFKGRQWGMIHSQGVASASQLALMSGMYTAVHCICQRIRMVEDGWNRGIAGCSTGLVLGWKAGPWSALQSCAGIGLISVLVDFGGGAVEAAEASALCQLQELRQQQLEAASASHSNMIDQLMRIANPAAPSLQQPRVQQQQHVLDPAAAGAEHNRGLNSSASHGLSRKQQQLIAVAAGPLHAVGAATKQLLAAPPLMFLGACCNSSNLAHAAAAPSVAAAAVDACELRAGADGRSNRK